MRSGSVYRPDNETIADTGGDTGEDTESTVEGPAVAPENLLGEFPEPSLVSYRRIRPAKYRITQPMRFAKRYGEFNRQEILKNFALAKDLALEELDQELTGLQRYVPAAAALKRQEISLDNIFNQAERTRQIDETLPEVRRQLTEQGQRAETYAQGRLPDAVQDAALSLNVRSRAADMATAGGFGATSSVARKTSDLMSAEQRLQVANYGEQLLTGNIGTKSSLLLAPTEYSNVGQEIRVMPEIGAGRLTAQALGDINAASLIPPATALSTLVQQRQFKTSLKQRTREFNRSNRLAVNSLNAQMQNQFKLGKFGYMVAQAGVEAGVETANNNTALGLAQQAQYADIFSDFMSQAQSATQTGAIASGIGEIISAGVGLLDTLMGGGTSGQAQVPQQTVPEATQSGAVAPDISLPDGAIGTDVSNPEGVVFPDESSVSGGYTPVQSNPDGTVTAIPSDNYRAATQPFSQDTGIPLGRGTSPGTESLIKGSNVALQTAGISRIPAENYQNIGFNSAGLRMYSDRRLLQSSDSSAGSNLVTGLQRILDPTGAFTDEDRSVLQQVATVAQDALLIATLTDQYQRGDKKGFVNTILGALKQPLIESLTKDPRNQAGLQAAYNAYQMFAHWNHMSPAQKSLAIASTGIQAIRFADGTNLATKSIIKPTLAADGKTVLRPGLTVGDALQLFSAGYNVYSMVDNWDQLNNLQRLAYGTSNLSQMAALAKRFGMLGTGTAGAEVAISGAELAAAGFSSTPAYGVGAAMGPVSAAVPEGYTVMAQVGDKVVIAPAGSASSVEGAVSSNSGSLLGTEGASYVNYLEQGAGAAAIAMGAYQIYKGWGTGGEKGALNGAIGGSSIAAGLSMLGYSNPYLLAGVVAVSALSGLVKTGKHKDQVARDSVRSDLESRGFFSKMEGSHHVTLADGTQVNVGIDGTGGLHDITDASRLSDEHKGGNFGRDGRLHSYDVDYTNDLDYTANMCTGTLMRLIYGGKGDATDKIGGQLANASISQVGFNQEMTEGNFNKMIENVRSFYVQNGITSKADAYQLANLAYAEGRINESDLVTMHQSINIAFDEDGYDLAKELMGGRDKGSQIAAENAKNETEAEAKGINTRQFKGAKQDFPIKNTKPDIGLMKNLNEARKTLYPFTPTEMSENPQIGLVKNLTEAREKLYPSTPTEMSENPQVGLTQNITEVANKLNTPQIIASQTAPGNAQALTTPQMAELPTGSDTNFTPIDRISSLNLDKEAIQEINRQRYAGAAA